MTHNNGDKFQRRNLSRRDLFRGGAALAGVGVLGSLGIAGCSSDSAASAGSSAATSSVTGGGTSSSGGGGKLTAFGLATFSDLADRTLSDSLKAWGDTNKTQTEYLVLETEQLMQKLTAGIEAGAPPNLALLLPNDVQYFRSQGLLADVSDVVSDLAGTGGGLVDVAASAVEYEGKSWGVPLWANPWPLYVRTDLTEEGLEIASWDDILELCVKYQKPDSGIEGFGFSLGSDADGPMNYAPLLWSMGGSYVSQDGSQALLDTDANRNGLAVVKKLWDQGSIPRGATGWNAGSNNEIYQSGDAIFIINAPSVYAALVQSGSPIAENTAFLPVPGGTPSDSWSWVIFKDAGNVDTAKQCLREWLAPDAINSMVKNDLYRASPYLNAYNDPYWSSTPQLSAFSDMLTDSRQMSSPTPPGPIIGSMMSTSIIPNMLNRTVLEDGDITQVARDANDQLQEIIDQQ